MTGKSRRKIGMQAANGDSPTIERILEALDPVPDNSDNQPKRAMYLAPSELSTSFRAAFLGLNEQSYMVNVLFRVLEAADNNKHLSAVRHNIMYALKPCIPRLSDDSTKLQLYCHLVRILTRDDNHWVRYFGGMTILQAKRALPIPLKEQLVDEINNQRIFYEDKIKIEEEGKNKLNDLKPKLQKALSAYRMAYQRVKEHFYDPILADLELRSEQLKLRQVSFESGYGIKLNSLREILEDHKDPGEEGQDPEQKRTIDSRLVAGLDQLVRPDTSQTENDQQMLKQAKDLLTEERKISERKDLLEQQMTNHHELAPLRSNYEKIKGIVDRIYSYSKTADFLKTLAAELK